jgi:hypothetical protein
VNVDVNLSGAVTATGFDLSALSGKVGEFNLNSLASFVGNLSLPNLGLITGNAFLQSLGATGVSFATLTSVTGAFLCDSNSDMVTLSLPVLASTGDLSISSSGLATISLPSLTTVSGNLNLMNNGSITSIVAAALSFANGDIDFTGNTIIVTVSLGGLVDITGNFAVNSLNALTTLTLTSLSTVGGQIDFSADPVLASVSLPALSSMGGGIMGANCTSLTSLSIGGGVTINSDLIMSGCTVLATVSIPNVQFNDGGFSCDFGNCAVTVGSAAAGTGVDGILRRCNLSALANETILLNGGTNASPTGGVTNADYVDLTSNGCVVLIN